jgi:hypothetical protein
MTQQMLQQIEIIIPILLVRLLVNSVIAAGYVRPELKNHAICNQRERIGGWWHTMMLVTKEKRKTNWSCQNEGWWHTMVVDWARLLVRQRRK